MRSSLVRLLAAGALYYATLSGTPAMGWPARRIRNWLIGSGLIVGSGIIGIFALLILMSSLFFQLADMAYLVRPAVITGGVGVLVSFLGIFQGTRWVSRP